jgi:hypothetical protein
VNTPHRQILRRDERLDTWVCLVPLLRKSLALATSRAGNDIRIDLRTDTDDSSAMQDAGANAATLHGHPSVTICLRWNALCIAHIQACTLKLRIALMMLHTSWAYCVHARLMRRIRPSSCSEENSDTHRKSLGVVRKLAGGRLFSMTWVVELSSVSALSQAAGQTTARCTFSREDRRIRLKAVPRAWKFIPLSLTY